MTNGCWDFVLSGAGQGYDASNEQYQYLFTSSLYINPNYHPTPDWDGSKIIDSSSTNLESLRMERIDPDCYWEVDILPLENARKISPGELVSGTYDEVLALTGDISYIEFVWDNDYKILNAFSHWYAIKEDQTSVCLTCLDEDEDEIIKNLPSGIAYIGISSEGPWKILIR